MIKACCKCYRFFNASCFYKNKTYEDKLAGLCKPCTIKQMADRYHSNPLISRNAALKRGFGITLDQYNELLAKQNYQCACCGTTDPRGQGTFHVDHCHKTGIIRGLLCHLCNTGIGKLGDDLSGLLKAVAYLEKSAAIQQYG
jgi:hypothetical protein